MKLRKHRKGFTLIELLVVVAIIALLILIAIQVLLKNIDKANDAHRKSDLQRIVTAFEDYYSDKQCYPDSSILNTCGGNALKDWGLSAIPCDPVYKTPYCYVTDADDPSCFQKYRVLNTLKYLSDPVIKLLGCDSGAYCGWETECGYTGGSGFNYGISSTNTTVFNPSVVTPGPPPPLPTPTGGPWGCTPPDIHGHSDCNNFGAHSCRCTYQFGESSCGASEGNYCSYTMYQCLPPYPGCP
jgi:prepilin-type N-terminal cleavage/methylation domain-containing protein